MTTEDLDRMAEEIARKKADGTLRTFASVDAIHAAAADIRTRDRFLMVLVALNALDIVTTTVALHLGAQEGNPLMKPVAHSVPLLVLVKLAFLAYIVWVVRAQPRARRAMLWSAVMCGIYGFVQLNNIGVIVSRWR